MVPGEICAEGSERSNRRRETALNAQKSAESIVTERRRDESVGVRSTTEKRGMCTWSRKSPGERLLTEKKLET